MQLLRLCMELPAASHTAPRGLSDVMSCHLTSGIEPQLALKGWLEVIISMHRLGDESRPYALALLKKSMRIG